MEGEEGGREGGTETRDYFTSESGLYICMARFRLLFAQFRFVFRLLDGHFWSGVCMGKKHVYSILGIG